MRFFPIAVGPMAWRKRNVGAIRAAVMEALESRCLLSAGYTFQQLASFDPSASIGSAPEGQLAIDKSGNVYGFTTTGGANGTGAAYEVQQGNGTAVLIASFPAAASGSNFVATGPVIDSAGDLFGVTVNGGDAGSDGTIFEIPAGSNSVSTITTFNSSATGSSPGGTLAMDASGDLFGTAANGGAYGCGTVWELPEGATAVTALASFTPVNVGGVNQNPGANGIAIDNNGNLFGTTGGNAASGSYGTVWELAARSNVIQTLTLFAGSNGANPVGGLAVDGNDNLFGVTENGGDNFGQSGTPLGTGVVWELPAGNSQIAVLENFDNMTAGESPAGGVVLDSKGNLFGTTSTGGNASGGDGTIWEIPAQSASGSSIALLTGSNGSTPRGNLLADSLGNVYGTASAGGANGGGAVFKMDFAGAGTSAAALSPAIAKATVPASIVAGARAHGTVTVGLTNSTSVPVRGAFTISIYASADGTIDDSAANVGSITRAVQVARNGTTAVSVPVASLNSLAQGTYTLLSQVSDAAGNVSSGATGPTLTVAPAFIALSETFARVTLPSNLLSGGKTRGQVTLKITNNGNVTSSGPVSVSLGLMPIIPPGVEIPVSPPTPIAAVVRRMVIPAGKSVLVTVPVTSIPSGLDGSYTLTAQVTDPSGAMTAAPAAGAYTVSPPTVTLNAAIDSFRPATISSASTSAGSISLTFTNNGNIPVGIASDLGAFDIEVSLTSQGTAQTVSLGSFTRSLLINPGQSRTLTLVLPRGTFASLAAGTYLPTIVVSIAGTSYSASATGTGAVTVT